MNAHNHHDWRRLQTLRHPAFAALEPALSMLASRQTWPDLAEYQRVLAATPTVYNAHGTPLRVIAPADDDLHYELRIDRTGELSTRAQCWHDFFQILVWRQLPRAKAALGMRHANAARARMSNGDATRNPAENACTLFDENGAIVLTDQRALATLLRQHAWRTLFVEERSAWERHIECRLFGHALYEKLLNPYVGLTAHAVVLIVPSAFWGWSAQQQRDHVDQALAEHLADPQTMQTPRALQPLPVLGIPSWFAANEDPRFYDNADYFRPPRNAPRA